MPSGRAKSASTAQFPGLDTLGELFSSRIRASVLAYLVAREEARFSLTELSRALDLSVSSVQHECYKLERLGVLKGRREGASRRYWLDREQPFVPVLMWLVITVVGQNQVLGYALQDIDGLHGAAISYRDEAPTLILVGTIGLDQLAIAQQRSEKILDLPTSSLNVAFYDPATWSADRHATIRGLDAPQVLVDHERVFKDLF